MFGIDEMYHLIQHVFVSRLEMTHQNELAAHLTESLVKGALARSGHQQTIKALCTMFDDYIVKNEQIPAHLREIVYKYGMKHCQNEHRNFDFMMARFNASQNPDERMAAAACLGCVNNSAIKAQVLAEIMDATRFKRNEINVVLEGFAPDLILWDWMVANWTDLYTLKDSGGLLAHVFTTCTGIYTDEFLQTVHEWEREHKSIETIQHKVDIVLEMLEIGNKWRRRDSAAISKWLADWSESLDVRRV